MKSSTEIASALLEALRRDTRANDLDFAQQPETVLGGNETTIYAFSLDVPDDHPLSGALIARIFFKTRDPLQHRIEALVHNGLFVCGYPVPPVRFVSDGDGVGAAWIVMDRLPGTMLGSEGLRMPSGVLHFRDLLHAVPRKLAELQLALHALEPETLREELTTLVGDESSFTPKAQINGARALIDDDDEMAAALRIMESRLPSTHERVICHGDFHPLNVLGDPQAGYGVIDWSNIRFADREFDVGSTLALLELTELNLPPVVRRVAEWVMFKMGVRYLDAYRDSSRAIDLEKVRYFYALRALVELIYARASGVPPLGDIGGWNVTRLRNVIEGFTGVRMAP